MMILAKFYYNRAGYDRGDFTVWYVKNIEGELWWRPYWTDNRDGDEAVKYKCSAEILFNHVGITLVEFKEEHLSDELVVLPDNIKTNKAIFYS